MSCHVYYNWSQWFSGTNHRRRGGRCQARARRVSLLRDGGVMEAAAAAAGAVADHVEDGLWRRRRRRRDHGHRAGRGGGVARGGTLQDKET